MSEDLSARVADEPTSDREATGLLTARICACLGWTEIEGWASGRAPDDWPGRWPGNLQPLPDLTSWNGMGLLLAAMRELDYQFWAWPAAGGYGVKFFRAAGPEGEAEGGDLPAAVLLAAARALGVMEETS